MQAGTFSTNLDLAGPTNNLVTTGNVTLSAAKVAGFDLASKLHTISALTGVKTGNDLEIEKMTTDMRVAPDGVKADNFDAVVPALGTLVGGGTIDSKNSLDFKMAATLRGGVGSVASASSNLAADAIGGLIGRATGGAKPGPCKGAEAVIPFQVKGTTSDPQFVPDVGGIAANMLKSQLGCAGTLLPGGPQAQQGNNPNNPLGALGGLIKKP